MLDMSRKNKDSDMPIEKLIEELKKKDDEITKLEKDINIEKKIYKQRQAEISKEQEEKEKKAKNEIIICVILITLFIMTIFSKFTSSFNIINN